LSGIGKTFPPDLFTGTGNFTVPIFLSPGRNCFQPESDLVYSTGNGNGPFELRKMHIRQVQALVSAESVTERLFTANAAEHAQNYCRVGNFGLELQGTALWFAAHENRNGREVTGEMSALPGS
jgi:hypothetical protein